MCFWPAGLRPALAVLFVQSLQLFFVGSPSTVPVCPPQALAGQVVWSRSFPPSCCSWRLGLPWCFCCGFLSPCHLVAPSPSVVSRLGFILWRLFGLGLVGCGPVLDPPFSWGGGGGGGASPSLVLVVFASLFQLFCCPGWGFLTLASCVCSWLGVFGG